MLILLNFSMSHHHRSPTSSPHPTPTQKPPPLLPMRRFPITPTLPYTHHFPFTAVGRGRQALRKWPILVRTSFCTVPPGNGLWGLLNAPRSRWGGTRESLLSCLLLGADRSWRATMDFRPREAPFFGDYFFRFGPIAFKFSHTSFQPKRRFLSIWSVNKKSIIMVLVIAS